MRCFLTIKKKKMINIKYLFCFFTLTLLGIGKKQNDYKYLFEREFKGAAGGHDQLWLTSLNSNGTFIYTSQFYHCFGHGEDSITGKYIIEGNTVLLQPEQVLVKDTYLNNGVLKGQTVAYSKATLPYFRVHYALIHWENRIYLIDQDDEQIRERAFLRFATAYNLGEEPEKHRGYFVYAPNEELSKQKLDKNQIPKEWRDYFLDNPILATVVDTKIEKKRGVEIYTLDKGSEDGVKKDFSFFCKNSTNGYYPLNIKNTFSKSSQAQLYQPDKESKQTVYKIGDIFTTSLVK
jgi:hypothetical protein